MANQGLVLFYCSFLALRHEDGKRPMEDVGDSEINMEKELFAG